MRISVSIERPLQANASLYAQDQATGARILWATRHTGAARYCVLIRAFQGQDGGVVADMAERLLQVLAEKVGRIVTIVSWHARSPAAARMLQSAASRGGWELRSVGERVFAAHEAVSGRPAVFPTREKAQESAQYLNGMFWTAGLDPSTALKLLPAGTGVAPFDPTCPPAGLIDALVDRGAAMLYYERNDALMPRFVAVVPVEVTLEDHPAFPPYGRVYENEQAQNLWVSES